MKAMILAAGRGERMRPLTDTEPKPLLEVGGKALIVWQIERLAAAGIHDLVINHSHLGPVIEAALGDGSRFGARIAYSRETEALDTAGGVANALPLLGSEPFLLLSGDLYADYDYAPLVVHAASMRSKGLLAHLVLVASTPLPPYHFTLEHDKDGMLIQGGGQRLTFSGIGAFCASLFAKIPIGAKAPLLPLLVAGIEQGNVSGELYAGRYRNLTTPAQLAELDKSLRH